MKKSQPSKRTLVIVERRKLPLDFSFNAPSDGLRIKKMRMLDTSADTLTLTHIVSTKDALEKGNLTISHCDNQSDTSPNKYLNNRVEEEVEVERLDETDVANTDVEIDIERVDDEEKQQIEATSKAKRDSSVQRVDHQGKNKKLKPVLSKEPSRKSTRKILKSTSKPTQKVTSTKPVAKAQPARAKRPVDLRNKSALKCHLCSSPLISFLQLRIHYTAAHNITIPSIAKHPHLQPDPYNADDFCQMCVKKFKSRLSFYKHVRAVHKINCSLAVPLPITIKSNDPTALENPNTKLLDSKSATVGSTSPNATVSLTPPSSDQSSATQSAPSTAASASKIQNDANDFAVKLFPKDGLMNRSFFIPFLQPSKENSPAKAPSPIIAPQSTMQRNLAAPYPDLLDPNHHCKCCNKTLSSKELYRKHCRTVHTMPLPDPDDPNFFCFVCNLKNPDLFTYRRHMRKLHQMKEFPEMFDIKCYHCPLTFAHEKNYIRHLGKLARREREAQLIEKRPPPVWDEPSFHCIRCLKTFENDKRYKLHLRRFHDMSAKDYPKSPQNVMKGNNHGSEVSDKEVVRKDHFFCFDCRKDFFDKHKFHQHLKEDHKLNLSDASVDNLKIEPSPHTFAKPLDPTLYYSIMKGAGQVDSK